MRSTSSAPPLLLEALWEAGQIDLEYWSREFVNRPFIERVVFPQSPQAAQCFDAYGSAAPCTVLGTPTFWVRTLGFGSDGGYVAVARVGARRWSPTENTLSALTARGSEPDIYVRDPVIGAAGSLPFQVVYAVASAKGQAVVPTSEVRVIRRASGWALVRLAPQQPFIASTLGVNPT